MPQLDRLIIDPYGGTNPTAEGGGYISPANRNKFDNAVARNSKDVATPNDTKCDRKAEHAEAHHGMVRQVRATTDRAESRYA